MTATSTPLVTVITPTFNRASFLDETIQSVLSQAYPNLEYLVLDDGSSDNTKDVVAKYLASGVTYIQHPNMGETRTVNKGFTLAKGEIVVAVNSDDPLLPGAIHKAVEALEKNPDALVAYPDWVEIDSQFRVLKTIRLPEYTLRNMLAKINLGMGPGTFIRRRVFEEVGLRDVDFRYAGDLDYWYRVALHGRLLHIPALIATHRVHPDAASSAARGARMAGELVRVFEKVFAHPKLPEELRATRRWVLAEVHLIAARHYSGSSLRAALFHSAASFVQHPLPIAGGTVRRVHALAGRVGARFVRNVLSAILKLWIMLVRWRLPRAHESKEGPFALVSQSLPPSWSGQSVALARILEGIDPGRYRLVSSEDYAAIKDPNATLHKLDARYLQVTPFSRPPRPPTLGVRSIPALVKTLRAVFRRGREIAKIVRVEGCARIVACSGDMNDLPAGFLASKVARVPFAAYMFDDYATNLVDPLDRFVTSNLANFFVCGANVVITPNEFLRDEYQARYGVAAEVIRNPSFAREPDASPPGPWPAREGEIRVVYTGAVYHVHFDAFRNLAAALSRMSQQGASLTVYSAQSAQVLEAEGIRGPITFHQHRPQDEIRSIQRGADILFLPLAFECSVPDVIRTSAPGKIGEYLASGRPILVHAPPDSFLTWYFKTHECGVVVDKNDAIAVSDAIRRLIEDEPLRAKIVRNALERAKVDFSPDVVRSQFLRALDEMPAPAGQARS